MKLHEIMKGVNSGIYVKGDVFESECGRVIAVKMKRKKLELHFYNKSNSNLNKKTNKNYSYKGNVVSGGVSK